MEYLVITLFFAAAWHFMYQAILLPSIHATQRNRLFALRDKLRAYHFENSDKQNGPAFAIAHDGINNAINSIEVLGLHLQLRIAQRYETDEAFRSRVKERANILRDSENNEIQTIVAAANNLLRDIFVLNSGGWFVYIVPIAIGVIFYQKIVKTTKDLFALGAMDADAMFGPSRQLLSC